MSAAKRIPRRVVETAVRLNPAAPAEEHAERLGVSTRRVHAAQERAGLRTTAAQRKAKRCTACTA